MIIRLSRLGWMKMNKIVSMYVAYVGKPEGKRRPVLIIENSENEVLFYAITSKFNTNQST